MLPVWFGIWDICLSFTYLMFICFFVSDDGQHLACSLANTSTQIFKMPLTGKGHAFAGVSFIIMSTEVKILYMVAF